MRFRSHVTLGLLLLAALLATACTANVRKEASIGDVEKLTSDDFAVIETVCGHYVRFGNLWSPARSGSFVAILTETNDPPFKPGILGPWHVESDALFAAFEARNDLPFRLPVIRTDHDVAVTGSRTAEALVKEGRFDETFPDNRGYLNLWLPGYSADATEALIYVYHRGSGAEGGAGAFGDLVRLKKEDGRWAIVKVEASWRT